MKHSGQGSGRELPAVGRAHSHEAEKGEIRFTAYLG